MMNLDINSDSRRQRVYASMYFKRIFNPRQMDLDYTFSQMIQICIAPTKVYKMTAWRKQTKNQWARDDPSFIMVTLCFVAAAAVAYSIAVRGMSISTIIKALIQSISFSLLGGLGIASLIWYCVNHYMRIQRPHSPEQSVEWLYSVDIHFNAFLPSFILLGVLQYLILPFVVKRGFFPGLVSGLFHLVSVGYYWYITFLGYMYLPFVKTPFILLVVGVLMCGVVLLAMSFGINITQAALTAYFI